ncbi:MAG: cytochrome c oxidase subunit 3 [Alphaproteobacteria bacterium]
MTDNTQSEAFRIAARERAADAFAMWIFLGSEAMLFGALLLVYLTARLEHAETFSAASQHLSLPLGTFNTAVLITSSLTMALAHAYSRKSNWRPCVLAMTATACLGTAFLAIKGYEYYSEFREGLAPVLGLAFRYEGPEPVHAEYFFNLYFTMTSLHAAHLLGGLVAMLWILGMWRRTGDAGRGRRILAMGLYWHFVDIVWVFLFPILYLIDR